MGDRHDACPVQQLYAMPYGLIWPRSTPPLCSGDARTKRKTTYVPLQVPFRCSTRDPYLFRMRCPTVCVFFPCPCPTSHPPKTIFRPCLLHRRALPMLLHGLPPLRGAAEGYDPVPVWVPPPHTHTHARAHTRARARTPSRRRRSSRGFFGGPRPLCAAHSMTARHQCAVSAVNVQSYIRPANACASTSGRRISRDMLP